MKIIKNRYVLLTIILLVISFLLCSKSFNNMEKEELYNEAYLSEFDWILEPGVYDEIVLLTQEPLRYRVMNSENKYGVIDENGALLLPCEYEELSCEDSSEIILVGGDRKYFMDFSGERINNNSYSEASCYYGDYASVLSDGINKVIDKQGNTIITLDEIIEMHPNAVNKKTDKSKVLGLDEENLMPVTNDVFSYVIGEYTGLVNVREKKIVVPASKYNLFNGYSEGFYIFTNFYEERVSSNSITGLEQSYYLDEEGNEKFKDIFFTNVNVFKDDVALVEIATDYKSYDMTEEKKKEQGINIAWGIVDKKGNYRNLPDELTCEIGDSFSEGHLLLNDGKKVIILDKNLKITGEIPIKEYMTNLGSFKQGLMPYGSIEKRKNKNRIGFYGDSLFGYINYKGEYVIEPIFDYADNIYKGKAIVVLGNKYGIINMEEYLYE